MTRPLSENDKLRAFRKATCSMEGAAERWAQRAARGLNDDQLNEALRFELGIFGGLQRLWRLPRPHVPGQRPENLGSVGIPRPRKQ